MKYIKVLILIPKGKSLTILRDGTSILSTKRLEVEAYYTDDKNRLKDYFFVHKEMFCSVPQSSVLLKEVLGEISERELVEWASRTDLLQRTDQRTIDLQDWLVEDVYSRNEGLKKFRFGKQKVYGKRRSPGKLKHEIAPKKELPDPRTIAPKKFKNKRRYRGPH